MMAMTSWVTYDGDLGDADSMVSTMMVAAAGSDRFVGGGDDDGGGSTAERG